MNSIDTKAFAQVDASRPDVFGNPGQLDLPLSGLQPAAMPQLNQAPSAEQADDWAQFINMDADGEEKGQQAGPDDREEAHNQQVLLEKMTQACCTTKDLNATCLIKCMLCVYLMCLAAALDAMLLHTPFHECEP